MPGALVLSYWNVNRPVTGGLRRVHALLEALQPNLVLCQPGPAHPKYPCVTLPRDWGGHAGRMNYGLFNFFDPSNERVVRQAVRDHAPSVIVMTSIWTFWPVRRKRDIPLVLDAHDTLTVAMAERYGGGHPFTRLVRYWEKRVAQTVDHLFVCSTVDRDHFLRLHGVDPSRLTVVPNGVDLSPSWGGASLPTLPEEWARRLADSCVLFFMGKPSYQPNTQGLRFLSETVLPELERRQAGRFKAVICGGEAPPGNWHPAMIFAGLVSDERLRAFLDRADICLAPTFTGSGTRLKVLEYLAAGKPVVSTPKGVEGLPLGPDRPLVVAEASAFSEAIRALADDPVRRRQLGTSGRAFVRDGYDWATCLQPRWRQVVERLASS